ncbi:MAG: flagellin [Methanoregula sp. PtaU1.Bin051]|nr:MAG: flagellin [Methanoregula sp. PtaU1.Bin051]
MPPLESKNTDAFTGLEAAIVLIAFVVVAAVFSYVVLGAGYYATQKSQESVYKSVEQATSNIQLVSQIYAISGNATSGIEKIKFSIGLAPGAPSMDINKMTIVYSNETVEPRILVHAAGMGSVHTFNATKNGVDTESIAGKEVVDIEFMVGYTSADCPGKNTRFNVEIKPAIGSAFLMSRTLPPQIYPVNVL